MAPEPEAVRSWPISRGSVRIRSADPADAPAIRYKYLATANDRRVMIEGLRWIRLMYAYPAYVRDELLEAIASEGSGALVTLPRTAGSSPRPR